MEKLVLKDNAKEINLVAEEKYARGIYLANSAKSVINNIRALDITFEPAPNNVVQHKLTKYGKWSFLTLKGAEMYMQYIFMPSATQEDFEDLLGEFKGMRELQEYLRMAFNSKDI